eukprot:scaffold125759_cov29-Tisochrysis_lutea.AAC.5
MGRGGVGINAHCSSERNSGGMKRKVLLATSRCLPLTKSAAACVLTEAIPPSATSAPARFSSRT